ncbi:helix-turn-helix domain-containing protein [Streptomyces sp. NPDC003032]
MTAIDIRHYDHRDALDLRPLLLEVYAEVCVKAAESDPFAAADRFAEGLACWSQRPGWTCVVGYDTERQPVDYDTERQPIDYAYGAPAATEETGTRTYVLMSVTQSPMVSSRTTRPNPKESAPERHRLSLSVTGRIWLYQPGRQVLLNPGDLYVYDSSLCFEALAGGAGAKMAIGKADTHPESDASRLNTVLLDLLTALFTQRLSPEPPAAPESRQRALLHSVQAYIRHHLTDQPLTPAQIAASQHISLRTLHRLFEQQDTTVAAWVRGERLERARRDLADPALATRPVHAIAARWGYSRHSDFTRAFRTQYGLPPQEYRRSVLPQQSGTWR